MKARQIKSLRRSLKQTQQQLASMLGLSFASVNRWENGQNVPTGLSLVLLQLVQEAVEAKSAKLVVEALLPIQGDAVGLVKTLVKLAHNEKKGK